MRRRIAMMLAVMCLMASMSTVSYAAGGDNAVHAKAAVNLGVAQPYYVNTANMATGLRIEGNTAYCYAEVIAKKACFINVVMRLQRKENGSWQTKVSWVQSSANAGGKVVSKSFTLSERGNYRVYVVFTVGGEELTCISDTKTY